MNPKNSYIIIGLGNPGAEYETTRHNAGRNTLFVFAENHEFSEFTREKKLNSLVSSGKLGKHQILLLAPETFMNKSGETVKKLGVLSKKHIAAKLIVAHDDLDLPLGKLRIVKNRSSAGHKGVESIIRALKTQDFIRIRIGIAKPTDIKKSQSQTAVNKIVIGATSPAEKTMLKKIIKKAAEGIGALVEEGIERAMNEYN